MSPTCHLNYHFNCAFSRKKWFTSESCQSSHRSFLITSFNQVKLRRLDSFREWRPNSSSTLTAMSVFFKFFNFSHPCVWDNVSAQLAAEKNMYSSRMCTRNKRNERERRKARKNVQFCLVFRLSSPAPVSQSWLMFVKRVMKFCREVGGGINEIRVKFRITQSRLKNLFLPRLIDRPSAVKKLFNASFRVFKCIKV